MNLNYRHFNPLGFYLMRYLPDERCRYIMLYGGSSSGKSYSVAQTLLLIGFREHASTLVYRKVGATIESSIYGDFRRAAEQMGMTSLLDFKQRSIRFRQSGAAIDFKGLDDPEKIKGISNYKRVYMDEWSEFDESDDDQMRLRLRGVKGQQIIYSWNPISEQHWIKKNRVDVEEWEERDVDRLVIDGWVIPKKYRDVKSIMTNKPTYILNPKTGESYLHESDTVMIQTTYLNNFWVVGSPDGTYGYYDEQAIAQFERLRKFKPDYYKVYALGEWGVIQTGSEFFSSFNIGRHIGRTAFDPGLPIHISIDNNRLPYISVSYWQIDLGDGTHIRQIDEKCAAPPDNTARKAAKLTADKLKAYGVGSVYLHGDATTRNGTTIDDEGRSFLDLFIDTMQKEGVEVVDLIGNRNPSVPMSGEFINAIFEGIVGGTDILIGEGCRFSIDDYMSVQKDVNGAILKTKVKNKATGQTYEEHGHLSDTFRYLVCDVLKEQFILFSNKRKRNIYARDGVIHFFNPDTACAYSDSLIYCMPNIGGRFVFVHGCKCGERWHIVRVAFKDAISTDEMKSVISECGCERVILECSKSYYMMARELREELSRDVRVIHENGDIPRRIAATADYVKTNVLFNETLVNEDAEYSAFMTSMLDYTRDKENIEGSAVMSGFVQTVLKLGL